MTSRPPSHAPRAQAIAATLGLLLTAGTTWGQQAPAADPPPAQAQAPADKGASDALLAIDAAYAERLKALDHDRLKKLQALAEGLKGREAAAVYDQLFRSAIAADLFAEAEPAADAALQARVPSPSCLALANLVKLIAKSDRGEFDQSLSDLAALVEAKDDPKPSLGTDELLGVADAYYQRLVHSGRYDVAKRAFEMILPRAESPAVKDYLASRLNRLKLIGQEAPPIRGVDLDGKPFDLAALRGKVVLVVFWATWCLPSAAEVDWLQETYDADHDLGFEIVGVNLDTLQEEGAAIETYAPGVRRFALDYNLRWPVLINGDGEADHAKAYGVGEIPASVLIDKDGKVVGQDLVRKNLESTVSQLVGR